MIIIIIFIICCFSSCFYFYLFIFFKEVFLKKFLWRGRQHRSVLKVGVGGKCMGRAPLRFRPKRTSGVQPPVTDAQSAGDIFSRFFDDEVLKLLSENTNMQNAAKNKQKGKTFAWMEITPKEVQKYLGLLLYMAVCDFPTMSDFWRRNTIFHVRFPATVMSRDQFRPSPLTFTSVIQTKTQPMTGKRAQRTMTFFTRSDPSSTWTAAWLTTTQNSTFQLMRGWLLPRQE